MAGTNDSIAYTFLIMEVTDLQTEVVSFDADGTIVDNEFVNEFWFEEIPRLYASKENIDFDRARDILKSQYDSVGDEDLRWYQPDYWFEKFNLPVIKKNTPFVLCRP